MRNELSRRRFHEITVAAFGGLLAGSITGCNKDSKSKSETTEAPKDPAAEAEAARIADLHVCRGLNTCKGKSKDGKNDCAGKGICATFEAHDCSGQNACKGQGGCADKPGNNECKEKGACHVPLMDHAWGKARKSLEEKMKAAGKEAGTAPDPA